MARLIFATLAGALFGLGLVVSGMTDTTKVQGWLDITGNWDPTLAFVLGGAIVPMAVAWRWTKRASGAKLGGGFPTPASMKLDPQLAVGSAFFGAGWALAGLCPGPAIASLSYGGVGGVAFFLAMIAGMAATPALRMRLFATQE